MNDSNDLVPSMLEDLLHSGGGDFAQDFAELAIDGLLIDGILKEIPIISTVRNIWKTADTINNALLIRKIISFLREFDKTKPAEREAFLDKLEDPRFTQKVGESIIALLDRLDDHIEKPIIIAKLFSSYIREEISYSSFLWLATAVERSFIVDLKAMLDYYAGKITSEDQSVKKAKRNLYSCGLSDFYVLSEAERVRGGLEHLQVYNFNGDSIQLAKIVLGDQYANKQ